MTTLQQVQQFIQSLEGNADSGFTVFDELCTHFNFVGVVLSEQDIAHIFHEMFERFPSIEEMQAIAMTEEIQNLETSLLTIGQSIIAYAINRTFTQEESNES